MIGVSAFNVDPTKLPLTGGILTGGLTLAAAAAGDGGLINSPKLSLQANFDADPTGGVTPTTRDFQLEHVMLTGGASPTSKLSFQIEAFEEFNIQRTASSAVFSRTGFSNALFQLDNNFSRVAYGGANWTANSSGALTAAAVGINWAHYNVNPTGNTIWISKVADSGSAIGFHHKTSVLDKDTFAPGALHTAWIDAGDDVLMSLTPGGDLMLLGDFDHDGSNVGFYGTTPVAQSAAYTPTNVVTDRAYDANATTLAEIADVLGTVIADLQATGLFG